MCGIAGFELAAGAEEEIGERLLAALGNRGPDARRFVARAGYGLAHTRLAVIDLSPAVTYPMENESGDLALLFNGEVYDHASLRSELERAGHCFRTRCDAEVIVHGYEQWGLDFLERIDGMFALALLDERREELVLARDALGIKPLVHTTSGRFAFSSDVLALVAAGLSDGRPDLDALSGYAAFHYVPMPACGITGIEHVEPGVALVRARDGRVRHVRWRKRAFTATQPPLRDASRAELARRTGGALDDSVRRQLVADVPVGVLLSSGIDSSLVLDSAIRAGAHPVAFTVGFTGHGDYDETQAARRFAHGLGVQHVCHDLRLDFHDAIDAVRDAYDQPFADSSALATLAVARIAREEVTVALSGTGGDDLFAGYYRHRAHLLLGLAQRAPTLVRALGGPRVRGDERRSAVRLARSYLARLAEASGTGAGALEQYLALAGGPRSSELVALIGGAANDERERIARRLGLSPESGSATLAAIQAFELRTYLPSDLLTKEDRATMAVGLEGRVPLLGHELLGLAESLGGGELISLYAGKRPLRALAATRLPRFVTRRRKRGFAVPLGAMFGGPWREPALAWLRESSSTLLDTTAAANALQRGELHPANAWAACALLAWEDRLGHARHRVGGVVPG